MQYVLCAGSEFCPHVLCVASPIFCLHYCQHIVSYRSWIVFALLLVHSALHVFCVVLCSLSVVLCLLCMYCELSLLYCIFCAILYSVNVVQELFKSSIVCLILCSYIVCIMYHVFFCTVLYELGILPT